MLDIDNYLTELAINQPRLALMMSKVRDAINQTANAIGVDSTSFQSAPHAPQSLQVKAANGLVHVTVTDGSQRSRALSYFVEHSTDPSFLNSHVVHLGASRGAFLNLPGLDDNGATQHWYFRAYSQYPGSIQRSAHQVFGGSSPTAVNVGGATQLTPLSSTGSGTASTSGQQKQGEGGFGKVQFSKGE